MEGQLLRLFLQIGDVGERKPEFTDGALFVAVVDTAAVGRAQKDAGLM